MSDGKDENITESDKEKMKTFLGTIFKQIPIFSGNPDDLDHFLDSFRKMESPSLTKTLLTIAKNKLQGPAAEAVKDKNFETLEQLLTFLVMTFKPPKKEKKDSAKSPKASTSAMENVVEEGVNIQQNVIDSTQEPRKTNQKVPKKIGKVIKTEETAKVPEKAPEDHSKTKETSKKDDPKPVRSNQELINKVLQNKKLMQLIDEHRRKNMKDGSTQTEAAETTNQEIQTLVQTDQRIPKTETKDQKCQTVKRYPKIIRNYITVNIQNASENMSTENVRREIIEKLDKSILKGTSEEGCLSPKTEVKDDESCKVVPKTNILPDKSTNEIKSEEAETAKSVEAETVENDSAEPTESKAQEDVKKTEDFKPKPEETASNPETEAETKKTEEDRPTGNKNSCDRPNNITLTGSRKRSKETERSEPSKRSRTERKSPSSPPKSKQFGDGRRKQDMFCNYCRKRGHVEEECRHKIKRILFCDYCNKRGHSEAQCKCKALDSIRQSTERLQTFIDAHNVAHNVASYLGSNGVGLNNFNFNQEPFVNSCYDQALSDNFNFN